MTARSELAAKTALVGFVLIFVLFFSKPPGQYRVLALGDSVPIFSLRQDDGQVISLADFRGKIVVLNFWATWCLPCIEEMPSLNRLTERYADRGVQIIGISLDEDPDAYKKFLVDYQIRFLTLRNPSHSVSEMYGTFKLPETYIISRDGRLLNKVIGAADWSSQEMFAYFDSLLISP